MKYDHSSLAPALEIVGRRTFSTLAAELWLAWAGGVEWNPLEWTVRRTAARSSVTSAVSYSQAGNGQLCFGMFVEVMKDRYYGLG